MSAASRGARVAELDLDGSFRLPDMLLTIPEGGAEKFLRDRLETLTRPRRELVGGRQFLCEAAQPVGFSGDDRK